MDRRLRPEREYRLDKVLDYLSVRVPTGHDTEAVMPRVPWALSVGRLEVPSLTHEITAILGEVRMELGLGQRLGQCT